MEVWVRRFQTSISHLPSPIFLLVPKFGNLIQILVMGRNTSISLGDHFEQFVDSKVASGLFDDFPPVFHALKFMNGMGNKMPAYANLLCHYGICMAD